MYIQMHARRYDEILKEYKVHYLKNKSNLYWNEYYFNFYFQVYCLLILLVSIFFHQLGSGPRGSGI
jgi:hypothetical protein